MTEAEASRQRKRGPSADQSWLRLTSSLWQRWPDDRLLAVFRDLLPGFRRLYQTRLSRGAAPAAALRQAFEDVCDRLVAAAANPSNGTNGGDILPKDCLTRLGRNGSGLSWLHGVASLLGMLMHFSIDPERPDEPVNRRRPAHLGTTYPTSAAVADLLAEYALAHLLREPVPTGAGRAADAERHAARALSFRLLDPSMESGQLLLALSLGLVRRVHRRHSPRSRAANRHVRALLERLCEDCLWGMDRNPVSVTAVQTVFSLLAAELGAGDLVPKGLLVGDSLEAFLDRRLGFFDGVINNPPWGELEGPKGRECIRRFAAVEHRLESYVAFAEGSLRCLQPGGVYGLVLPSQAIATHNSRGLRRLLAAASRIEDLILLPRAAFAQATVRGLVLLGQAQDPGAPPAGSARITLYPLDKRLDAHGPVVRERVPRSRFGAAGWTALWGPAATLPGRKPTVELGDVASVMVGVGLYNQGRGVPPQTLAVVQSRPYSFPRPLPGTLPGVHGRHVEEFRLRPPEDFVRYGPWLAEAGPHGLLLQRERIFVRELCRRDGKLNAALAVPGVLPLRGVQTVLPMGVASGVLIAILNSRVAARYVSGHTASFSKVDFQRIQIRELRRLPIPITALTAEHRRRLGFAPPTRREVGLCRQVGTLARRLAAPATTTTERKRMRDRLEDLVAKLYDGLEPTES